VKTIAFQHVKAQKTAGVPALVLLNVEDLSVHGSSLTPDTHLEQVRRREM
jgi:hypothetical protein